MIKDKQEKQSGGLGGSKPSESDSLRRDRASKLTGLTPEEKYLKIAELSELHKKEQSDVLTKTAKDTGKKKK